MREILFRGKRKDCNDWEIGNFSAYSHSDGTKRCYINGFEYEVYPETVGQYTGLTDKNGKKIFEGDIVAMGIVRAYEVKYDSGSFYMDGTAIPIRHIDRFEVIGNIHDNPELLKGGVE